MAWARKNRPRKGRRKRGSKWRKAKRRQRLLAKRGKG